MTESQASQPEVLKRVAEFSSECILVLDGKAVVKYANPAAREATAQGNPQLEGFARSNLAWVLAQGDGIFTIPGTRRIERLKENLGASKVQFTAEELADIRERLPRETTGSRY